MNIEIANRLVKMRKEKGYSQEELADALGISRQAVSKWERAEASPDTDNLICLAKLYKVSLDDLLSSDESVEDIVREQKEKNEEEQKGQDKIVIEDGAIHLTDEDGSQVYITKKGVKAFDSDGNIVQRRKGRISSALEGPLFLLAIIGFILIGTLANFWYGSWVLFFIPEIISSIIRCFEKKDPNQFNMPFLCCFVFFFVCMVHPGMNGRYYGLWHPMWVVFLGIPFYYAFIGIFFKNEKDCGHHCCGNDDEKEEE